MRFLIEKSIFDSPNEYDKIRDRRQRFDYINNFLNSLPNAQHLKKAKDIYIDSILENGHNDLTNKFIPFIRNIYFDAPKNIVSLIKELVDKNKLNLKDSKVQKWLYSSDLYNRPEYDIDYTIKALTLASNPDLQKEDGVNKFSDKDLKITNFYKDGKLLSAEQIKDVLRNWQTKELDLPRYKSKSSSNRLKQVFKDNNPKMTDDEVDTKTSEIINTADEQIKNDIADGLINMGIKRTDATALVNQYYKEGDTAEELMTNVLRSRS